MTREKLLELAMKHRLDPHKVTSAWANNIPYTEVTLEQRNMEKAANLYWLYSSNRMLK